MSDAVDESNRPADLRRKICFVTVEFHGLFKNGGIGTANTALALALTDHGFDVTVAIADSDAAGPRLKFGDFQDQQKRWRARGITLDFVRSHPNIEACFDDPRAASYCVYLYLKSGDFDVVMFNDNGGQAYYSLLAKYTGVFRDPPLMCVVAHGPIDWVHELNDLEYYSRIPVIMSHLERRSAALADILISPSHYLLNWMIERNWVPAGRGNVIQNLVGVDPAPLGRETDFALQPVEEIVFFGRQETRKGVALFCDALELLDGMMDIGAFRVTVLGKFSRLGAMHSGVYLTERARRWRSSLRVLAVYDQTQALEYLRRPGVIAIIPSRAENSPCVVAECLQCGVLFLAADSGGTAELIAPDDRAGCLFFPEPRALASRLRDVLQNGHRRARMTVPPADTLAQWVRLLAKPPTNGGGLAAGADAARVSVCLAWSKSPNMALLMDSLRAQSYRHLEIIVAVDESPRDSAIVAGEDAARFIEVRGAFAGIGAARNAAARRATGDYLLFIDEVRCTLLASGVNSLIVAAQRTGADILTGLRDLDCTRRTSKPPTAEWEFPLGGCSELGAFENCFGEGAIFVKAEYFATTAGFAVDCANIMLEWLFLAGASLNGVVMEVVPTPILRIRDTPPGVDSLERTMADQRRILDRYLHAPISTIRRIVEMNLQIGGQNLQRMQRAVSGMAKPARDIALQLASLEPNSREAMRLFLQYSCERKMIEFALDFALHNELTFWPEAVTAIARANEAAALRRMRVRRFDVRQSITLSEELFARARPFYRLRVEDLSFAAGTSLEHCVPAGDSIIKISGACPPGTLRIRLEGVSAAVAGVRLAAVACRSWARPVLSQSGMVLDGSAWWSGWIDSGESMSPFEVAVNIPEPLPELLDLYLIARRTNSAPSDSVRVIWNKAAADAYLTGDITASAIEVRTVETAVPIDLLKRGELLTDIAGVPFRVFIPGERVLLHPVLNRLALVRVPDVLPPGSIGLRCVISVEHKQAHAIEFGIWVRPSAAPAAGAADLVGAEHFSGWILIDTPFEKRDLTVLLPQPTDDPMDMYLATRVAGAADVYFCHAFWRDFFVLENSCRRPKVRPSAAPPEDTTGLRTTDASGSAKL